MNNEPVPVWDEQCWQQPALEAAEAAYLRAKTESKSMSWSMQAGEGGDFEQPPTGPQAAALTRIVDIGTHTDTSPLYGEQRRHQVIFMWELAETMTDGRPFTIQKFYTLSMHEKANLRKDLESWRGQAFATGEDIQIDAALGKSCLLNIGTSEKGKSKVVGISRLPKGMPDVQPVGPLLVFRTDDADWSVYEQLSEYHQKRIQESEEWPTMQPGASQAAPAERQPVAEPVGASAQDDGFIDDDVPFSNHMLRHGYVIC